MMSWFKSLITEVPAGTFLVAASMSLVVILLVALGEIAGSVGDDGRPGPASGPRAGDAARSTPFALDSNAASPRGEAPRATRVSVMEPVGVLR